VKGTLMVFFSVGAVSSLEDVAGFSKGRLIKCTTHCARPLRHFLLKLKSIVVMRFEIYTLSFFPFFPQFLFFFCFHINGFYSIATKGAMDELCSSSLLCFIGCNKFILEGELDMACPMMMQLE
jgi:hypothetical protein